MQGHKNEEATRAYTECMKSMEHLVRWCNKCRRTGCEMCDTIKSLRYVARWQKPGEWWKRSTQHAIQGTVRFLKGKCGRPQLVMAATVRGL